MTATRRRGVALRKLGADALRSVPAAGWLIALVAVLAGFTWSLLVPPLQAHDEPAHVYYSQFLAETGQTPRPIPGLSLSEEQYTLILGLRLFDVVGNADGRPPWTRAEDRSLDEALDRGLARTSQGADGGVGLYPPGYYLLGSAAYLMSPSHSLQDRLFAMRLVSVLLAGISALFVFLFVRELLPRHPWTWAPAALVAALQPKLGFMSGVFNPDIAMIAAASVLFFALARAFRTRLTVGLAVTIGLAVAAGVLAKLAALGLVPGAALAVLALAWRDRDWKGLAAAAAAAGVPLLVYTIVNVTIWNRPVLLGGGGAAGTQTAPAAPRGNWRETLVYIWQDYFPRLPFMNDMFPGYPLWNIWFDDWAGRFGWGDYELPQAVKVVVAVVMGGLLISMLSLIARGPRAFLRRRGLEMLSYLALAGGLCFLLAYTGYGYTRDSGLGFEQGRYLLPLIALFAGLVAAGLRGLGSRAGPVVASALVMGAFVWSAWGMVLTVTRFYG
jgi:4-amino-4-deoxy-L-arabinose transferase-like glycosyltransferase